MCSSLGMMIRDNGPRHVFVEHMPDPSFTFDDTDTKLPPWELREFYFMLIFFLLICLKLNFVCNLLSILYSKYFKLHNSF